MAGLTLLGGPAFESSMGLFLVEAEQRDLALRLRASLDSLGVAVFDAGKKLTEWNECFQVLLDLPKALVRLATPAFVEFTAGSGEAFLESEDQIRYGRFWPAMADPAQPFLLHSS